MIHSSRFVHALKLVIDRDSEHARVRVGGAAEMLRLSRPTVSQQGDFHRRSPGAIPVSEIRCVTYVDRVIIPTVRPDFKADIHFQYGSYQQLIKHLSIPGTAERHERNVIERAIVC